MIISTHLQKLYEHQFLTREEAQDALLQIATGNANNSQIASLTTIFLMRSIRVEELEGFVAALLQMSTPVKFEQPIMDVCGTGGDCKNTFNISTLSAFVAAASGVTIAKHGNYGVSSVSGSSNVLEAIGYKFSNNVDELQRQLDKANICFMHAPLFHPAMKYVAPIRKELGVRTIFNILGPLVNPAHPSYRLIGVFSLELGRVYHYLLQKAGKPYSIVHSLDGYDEISTTGDFKLFSLFGEEHLSTQSMNMSECTATDLFGGNSVNEAAEIFMNVLQAKGTPAQHNAVIANSAQAITCATNCSLQDAVETAKDSLLSKKAYHTFKNLLEQMS